MSLHLKTFTRHIGNDTFVITSGCIHVDGTDYLVNICGDNFNLRRKIISDKRASYWRHLKPASKEYQRIRPLIETHLEWRNA